MCLTHRVLLLCTLGLLLVGCTDVTDPLPTGFSSAPIIQDDAMSQRQWGQVSSLYANGTSVGNPIYYNYTARRDVPDGENIVTGPVIFTCQTISLPVLMVITPPWEEVVWRGVYTPPTFTAVPATPNDAAGYAARTY